MASASAVNSASYTSTAGAVSFAGVVSTRGVSSTAGVTGYLGSKAYPLLVIPLAFGNDLGVGNKLDSRDSDFFFSGTTLLPLLESASGSSDRDRING
jgi:hypothetical protein